MWYQTECKPVFLCTTELYVYKDRILFKSIKKKKAVFWRITTYTICKKIKGNLKCLVLLPVIPQYVLNMYTHTEIITYTCACAYVFLFLFHCYWFNTHHSSHKAEMLSSCVHHYNGQFLEKLSTECSSDTAHNKLSIRRKNNAQLGVMPSQILDYLCSSVSGIWKIIRIFQKFVRKELFIYGCYF